MHPLFLILSPSNCCPVENAPIYAHPYITLSEKFSSSVHIAMHCCPAENADTVVEWKYAQLSVRWVYLLLTGHNLPPLSLLPQLYPNPCSIPSADNCQFQQLSHNVYFSVQENLYDTLDSSLYKSGCLSFCVWMLVSCQTTFGSEKQVCYLPPWAAAYFLPVPAWDPFLRTSCSDAWSPMCT